MADHQNLVWLSSPTEAWSLSCLVSEHISMPARQPQPITAVKEMTKTPAPMNNELAASEVINVDYLSVSSRESVTDQDVVIGPASTGRSKRKRGNPWSENEHSQFLQGLQVHGKGKWKKISRDFVKTRSPVQVASHAQKFFDRHNSSKPKKRKSINDITSFPSAETLIQPHVYTHTNPNPPYSFTYDLPPLPDFFYETDHIFGNYFVPAATDLISARLTNHESKMHLPCHASYDPVITYPNVQSNVNVSTDQDLMVPQVGYGCLMMEPQFQSPFLINNSGADHISVPKLIDGDYSNMSIDMSILEELLPPL